MVILIFARRKTHMKSFGRGDRVVEGARLEIVCAPKGYRGFESPPLRQCRDLISRRFLIRVVAISYSPGVHWLSKLLKREMGRLPSKVAVTTIAALSNTRAVENLVARCGQSAPKRILKVCGYRRTVLGEATGLAKLAVKIGRMSIADS